MEYKRPIYHELYHRFLKGTNYIQVISGPRQIGKTTLVKQLFQQAPWHGIYRIADGINNDSIWIENQVNEAILIQKTIDKPVILAIDEIQKINNWSETIKRIYDLQKFNSDKPIQLLLLGSSNWLMQKGLSESLAGRFEQWNLTHWTFNELRDAFNITPEQFVYFGAYPGSIQFISEESRWKSYVRQSMIETTLTKDVLLMNKIEKPALIRSLFELGTAYSGQILSYNKIMGQLQDAKNTTTLAHYLKLLEESGMLMGINKFAMDTARKRSSSPKWQVMNNGIMGALSEFSSAEVYSDNKRLGRFVESAIGAHLIAHLGTDLKLFYWNESNAEVDFILQKGTEYIGIEVKLTHDKISGIAKFQSQFKPKRMIQLSNTGISWQQFITIDPREWF